MRKWQAIERERVERDESSPSGGQSFVYRLVRTIEIVLGFIRFGDYSVFWLYEQANELQLEHR